MSDYKVTDKRGARTASAAPQSRIISKNLNSEMRSLRNAGHTLPKNNTLARAEVQNIKSSVNNRTLTAEMRRTRTAGMNKTASNVQLALPKNRKPMSSLEDKGIPFDTTDPNKLIEIRKWCRLFYTTHDLIPLLIDIYAKFPVVGLEFDSKDPQIKEFYTSMFMDTLDYQNFLQDLGREYFISGEVNSLAHFDDTLGIWSSEEIMNPDTLRVSRSMFHGKERVQLLVKDVVEQLRGGPDSAALDDSQMTESEKLERNWEYQQIVKYYPEMIEAAAKNDGLDISDMLISRIVNKVQPWDVRGTPHLLRSFRTLMMEESLNAAQDAVADRLYSPFILATLGLANLDGEPWVPDQEDLDQTRDDMQAALAADFRLMVHNFGLDIKSVFGRESVPRFDTDYNRIDKKLMQAWGIGESLISGGSGGPYASSALNREFVTQMMSSYQNAVKRHILKRCEVIAEAQGHYDYETTGSGREPVYREIVDPDTGELRKVPKLLLPEVKFQSLNLRDEAQERSFLQQLKANGVPISDGVLAVNIPIDFDQELERASEERVNKYIAKAQELEKARAMIEEKGLPMPPELAKELAAQYQLEKEKKMADQAASNADSAKEKADQDGMATDILDETGALPTSGNPNAAGGSGPNDMDNGVQNSISDGDGTSDAKPKAAPAPRNKSRPAESDEQKGSEPKAAKRGFGEPLPSGGMANRISDSDLRIALRVQEAGSNPAVEDLVSWDGFYAALNQRSFGYEEIFPEIQSYHAARDDKTEPSIKEAHAHLEELLEQYSMVHGVEPVWS